ncbi:hypothetical protein JCM4814A_88560 [Streptomyces phaeofaciens JCM 4814]|uniref:Alpha/beta hydrolase n=1 Tax=Streptomyces phaeofaciens TaxID=68254 RepID=A0A918LXQ2_9ACTN|nr:alpha/beta hydrolase [Streptomyces phaeofaciens]GGT70297.1 hypothetical protein GCM10010226_55140 [Streptomyces phaeofaciens]
MSEYTDHHGPEGLLVRGTVVVVPGRGETRATYRRLGSRLAADAYRVRVVDAPDLDGDDPDSVLDRFAARLDAAVEGTAGENGVAEPVVLVGADAGAVAVAALLAHPQVSPARPPHAVVLAGLPGHGTVLGGGGWDDELDARTSCPTHRGTLSQDIEVRRGLLDDPLPEALLTAAYGGGVPVPALLLVGDDDPLADRAALGRLAKALPQARLSVVHGAHHDVLNDLQHRSVAAEVVTFLETLRNDLRPLVAVETSAW